MGFFRTLLEVTNKASEMSNDKYASEFGYNDGYYGKPPSTFPFFIERCKKIYMDSYRLGQQRAIMEKSRTTMFLPPQQL